MECLHVFTLSLNLLNWNMDWLIGISYHKWFHQNSVRSVYSPAVSIHVCIVSRAETRGDTTASHDPTMYFSKNCHCNVFEHIWSGLSLWYSEEGSWFASLVGVPVHYMICIQLWTLTSTQSTPVQLSNWSRISKEANLFCNFIPSANTCDDVTVSYLL